MFLETTKYVQKPKCTATSLPLPSLRTPGYKPAPILPATPSIPAPAHVPAALSTRVPNVPLPAYPEPWFPWLQGHDERKHKRRLTSVA